MAVTIGQAGFRLRNDDGNETTATWKAAQNTNVNIAADLRFRARFLMQNAGTTALANLVAQLEYTLNGGASTNVTAASSVVRASASPNVTDAANITQQLSGGTGTFIGLTGFDEGDGAAGGNSLDVPASGNFEVEFAIVIRAADVTSGDTIGLRVTNNGTDFTGSYTQVPAIIVTKPIFTTNDAVTVAESVTPYLSIYLSANDAVSLYDLTNQEINYSIIVTDSATVAFGASSALAISANDAVTVAESSTALLPILIPTPLAEAITVAESATTLLPQLVIAANEAVAIAESITAFLPILVPAQSEAITASEATTLLLPMLFVTQLETISIADAPAMLLSVYTSSSDNIALTEQVLAVLPGLFIPAQFEAIAITDAATTNIIVSVNSFDNLNILEAITLSLLIQPQPNESISITDNSTLVIIFALNTFDAVAIAEIATAFLPKLVIAANEAIAIAESSTATLGIILVVPVDQFEAVALTESATAFLPKLNISTNDAVAAAENLSVATSALLVSAFDAAALTDLAALAGSLSLTSFDAVASSEQITALLPVLKYGGNEAVSIAEQTTLLLPTLLTSQADAVAVAESLAAKLAFLTIPASESVTLAEFSSVVVQLSKLTISVFDNVNFSSDPIPVAASESVAVAEAAQATGLLYWSLSASLGSAASKSANQSSLVLVTSTVLEAGACAIVLIAVDNSQGADGDEGAVTNVFDSVGNTYLKAREFTNGNGAAQAGATIAVWYTTASLQLNSGGTITAQFSNSTSRDAAAISARKIALAINGVVAVAGSAALANDIADPGILDLTLSNGSYLWVRAQAHEGPSTDVFTQTLSYDASFDKQGTTGGIANTNMTVAGEVSIKVATSNPSDPSWSSATNEAAVIVAFRLDPAILINMAEAVAANELAIPLIPQLFITADDAVAIQEQIVMALAGLVGTLPINTGDAVAITETGLSIFSRLLVNANDAIAIAESINQSVGFITARNIQVAENVAASENIILSTRIPVSVFDSVHLYLFLPNDISVADAISTSENFNLTGQTVPAVVPISINTFENVVVDIPETHVLDDIAVSELTLLVGATGVDWFSIGSLGSAFSKSADQATLVLQAGAIAEAGNMLVALIAVDNSAPADGDEGAVSGIVDQAGNSWIKIGEFTNGNGAAQAGVAISAWYSLITTQIAANALITASFTSAALRDASAITVWEFGLRRTGFVSVAAVATRADDNADPGVLDLTLPVGENLWVRGQAHERPLTDTWVKTIPWDGIFDKQGTSGGVADTNVTVAGEFRVFNGASNPSDPSWTAAADEAGILFAFKLNPSVAPSAFDAVALSEFTSLRVARLTVNTNDGVTVADAIALTQTGQLAAFDGVAVTDALALRLNLPLSQFEAITISDLAAAIISKLVVASFETISVADAITVATITFPRPDVADTITVSELSVALLPQLKVSAADATITVLDQVSFLSSIGINRDDSVTLTDLVALHIPRLFIPAFDNVTVADPMALELFSFGQAFEGDFIVASDAATLFLTRLSIAAFDSAAVADFAGLVIGTSRIDVADSVGAAEAVTIRIARLTISSFDAVAVAELASVAIGTITVNAGDQVSIAENSTVRLPKIVIAAGDDVTIADFNQARFTVPVTNFDGVSVLDDVTALLRQRIIVASENVVVGQLVAAQISIQPSVGDAVTVIENTALVLRVVTLFIEEGDTVLAAEEIGQIAHGDPLSMHDSVLLEDATDIMLDRLNIQVADDLALSEQLGEFHGQYVFVDQADDVTVDERIRPIRRRGRRYTRFTRSSITPRGPTKTDTEM